MNNAVHNYRIDPQLQWSFDELLIDSFCGGGGASTGIEQATGRPVDIAINHDANAISMHTINHPQTKHYNESVWNVDPIEATKGQPVGGMWFSPDCRHHSKAKGGKPVEKKVRGLAWVVLRWAAKAKPRIIWLENVEEFATWGPLTRSKRPNKARKGETFEKWKSQLVALGYTVEHRILKACDYGVPTTRKRLFIVARRDGRPIIWPEPSHGPSLKKYKAAADIIDWSIPCPSIFERKKPLAEKTMQRIARGIEKFVINNPKPFILRIGQTGWGKDGCQYKTDQPLTTITTKAEHCLVTPIIDRQFGKSEGNQINDPLGTITAGGGGKSALCQAFLAKHYGGNNKSSGIDMNSPLDTITTIDHHSIVSSHMIKFRGDNTGSKTDAPVPTISSQGNHIGEVRAFLLKYYGKEKDGNGLNDPLHTISTKDRFGIITVLGQDYQIIDIGMRMLQPHELYAAHGFPSDYIFSHDATGKPFTKKEQVAKVGNSVPPMMAKVIVEANYQTQLTHQVPA
ncbi:MAG: DNA cytosine methyltransferase [Arenicella sp.]